MDEFELGLLVTLTVIWLAIVLLGAWLEDRELKQQGENHGNRNDQTAR